MKEFQVMRNTIIIHKFKHIPCGQVFFCESGQVSVICPKCNKDSIGDLQSIETVETSFEVYIDPHTGVPTVKFTDKKDAAKL